MPAQIGAVSVNEGRVFRLWFEIDQYREPTQVSQDTNEPYTEDDKEGTSYTTASTGEEVILVPNVTYSLNNAPILFAYSSDNPTEVDVSPNGDVVFMVAPEATASAIITITATSGTATITRTVSVTLTLSGASVINVIEGGVAGSARKALSDPMDTALAGANPATQQKVYTSQDHSAPAYVRNTSFFLNSHVEAMTCASPWNSVGGKNRAGTAITKRHALLNTHYPYGVGTIVRFIESGGGVVDRTVVQAQDIYPDNGYAIDQRLVLFDSDLPASITPCKVFPAGFETYLPAGATSNPAQNLPLLFLDQEENGVVLDLLLMSQPSPARRAVITRPVLPDRLAFHEGLISGDSGNPCFVAIGSELWLMSTAWTSFSSTFVGSVVPELNAMITTLDTLQGDITGYTVTVGDLSSYTTY